MSTSSITPKAILTQTVKALASVLAPLGYQRQGLVLVSRGPEVVSMIEHQIGRGATKTELRFVVNYGVIVPSLLRPGEESDVPTYTECHWGRRVQGSDARERWWDVRQGDSPEELLRELKDSISGQVLPAFSEVQTESALAALWQTGNGPGLGHARRLLCLGILLHRMGKLDEFARARAELESLPTDPFVSGAIHRLRGLG